MSPRELFFPLDGKKHLLGACNFSIYLRKRTIETIPSSTLNGDNYAFSVLESVLRDSNYEPKIYEDGRIILDLPVSDKYGWILREIARAYLLAGNTRNLEASS